MTDPETARKIMEKFVFPLFESDPLAFLDSLAYFSFQAGRREPESSENWMRVSESLAEAASMARRLYRYPEIGRTRRR